MDMDPNSSTQNSSRPDPIRDPDNPHLRHFPYLTRNPLHAPLRLNHSQPSPSHHLPHLPHQPQPQPQPPLSRLPPAAPAPAPAPAPTSNLIANLHHPYSHLHHHPQKSQQHSILLPPKQEPNLHQQQQRNPHDHLHHQYMQSPIHHHHQPEPFPNSKSLPFPISPNLQSPLPPPRLSPQQSHPAPTIRAPLYNIAKLHAANCTILLGKVYNDHGHNICGVLNQHEKPCRRIGKCPFHGYSTPVSAENSCNGVVDASGTAHPAPTSPGGTSPSSAIPNSLGAFDSSSGISSSGGPRAPPKKMQIKHGWTKEEHFLFLGGLEMHGKGSWKQISSVVKSRTPTQVQSHAQKYFLRQKQNNKNKRSIHDLSMDSPEMRDLEKRVRNGEFSWGRASAFPNMALSDSVHTSPAPDALRDKLKDVTSGALGQSLLSCVNGNVGAGSSGYTDLHRGRYRSGQSCFMTSRFSAGQAMSATTLASSLSSGVQVATVQSSPHRSPFATSNASLGRQDIFAPVSTSVHQHKLYDVGGGRSGTKLDALQSRDVIAFGARPPFGTDNAFAQQHCTPHSLSGLSIGHGSEAVDKTAHIMAAAAAAAAAPPPPPPPPAPPTAPPPLVQQQQQQHYVSGGFTSLRGSTVEGNTLPWYDSELKAKRDMGDTFANTSMAQEADTFDASQAANSGFTSGIFGAAEGVEVTDVYGVSSAGASAVHAFAGSTGMQIGSLTTRE